MSRLFISHASADNGTAIALGKWLSEQGFDDVFLDIDPDRGLAPGERWQDALKAAADRCEAVLFLVSPAWLASRWCLAEYLLAKNLHKRIFGVIVEPVSYDRLPTEITAEWQLCVLAGADRLRTIEVEVLGKVEHVEFREDGLELLRRGLERAGLDARSFPWPPRDDPYRAPYRGLKALEPQDAAIFFGREAWILRGLDQIRGLAEAGVEKLFMILGASGSGKSSFLRAGLWPRLLRDDRNFLALPIVRPQSAVITGRTGLAVSLADAFGRLAAPYALGDIKDVLANSPDGMEHLLGKLLDLARRRLVPLGEISAEPTIILSLDQAEELFNPDGATETAVFFDLLAGSLAPREQPRSLRLLLVATMRSDRYELLQSEPRLGRVRRALFDLPPIPSTDFKSIIEGPLRRVAEGGSRLTIDHMLTERLIADAKGADALPLLAFTLERLYADYGVGVKLTVAEYEKLGGVKGSIVAAIANALAEPGRSPAIPIEKEGQLTALRSAFIPWLARINPETGLPLRRVAVRHEIPANSVATVERLIDARLLTSDRRAGADTVEIAHESLLRQWPTLTQWLEADAEDLKLIEGVERAAGEWARNGRLEAWLDHRGDRLALAERLMARDDFRRRLDKEGNDYLAECRARDVAASEERGRQLAQLKAARIRTLTEVAPVEWARDEKGRAARFAVHASREYLSSERSSGENMSPDPVLASIAWQWDQQAAVMDEKGAENFVKIGSCWTNVITANRNVWDGSIGKIVQRLQDELGFSITRVVFSADEARIAANLFSGTVIWDRETGSLVAQFSTGSGDVSLNNDGSYFAAPQSDVAIVWNLASKKRVAVLGRHRADVSFVSFSPEGRHLVTTSDDRTARLWHIERRAQVAELRPHEAPVTYACFSPDGSQVVTVSANSARIWDIGSSREIAVLRGHERPVRFAIFSQDGLRIATVSADNTARIWEAATGALVATLANLGRVGTQSDYEASLTRSAVFCQDGSQVVTTAMSDKAARVWDIATAKEIAVVRCYAGGSWSINFNSEDRIILTSWTRAARAVGVPEKRALNLPAGEDNEGTGVTVGDVPRNLTASKDGILRLWDGAIPIKIAELCGHNTRFAVAAVEQGGERIIAGGPEGIAAIWALSALSKPSVLRGHAGSVLSADFCPDGLRVATGSADRTARIWNVDTLEEIQCLNGHFGDVTSVVFSPDGSRIATASEDRTTRLWDALTGTQMAVLRGHEGTVTSVTFSPDSRHVITASSDTTVRIWDVAAATETAVLRGHSGAVTCAGCNPSGSRVVSTSWDRSARVWDFATGKEIAVLQHGQLVNGFTLDHNGSRVATVSDDNTVRIWEIGVTTMSTRGLVNDVCRRILRNTSVMNRYEMRTANYPDDTPEIDVCAGIL